jgi:dipeptidyl aminopeptidase/acylaminoacyl peptidase
MATNTPAQPSTPVSSETQSRIPTQPPSITEKPSETLLPMEYPTLNPRGPYILSDWILLNPDGSGMRSISFPKEFSLYNYSPDGEWGVLFKGGYESGYGGASIGFIDWDDEMSINLLHVPDGKIIKVSLVITQKILYENDTYGECGDPLYEMIQVKWSPDGRYLAFIADPTGTSLDLFTYDTDKQILRRLTNDSADVVDISWSPDGKKLFYINGIRSENWKVHPDDTYATHTLNMTEPENSTNQGIQTFYSGKKKVAIQWMDHEDGLIYTTTEDVWCMTGGDEWSRPMVLNYLNLGSGEKNTIWPESATQAEAFDPINRTILLFEKKGDDPASGYIVNLKGEVIAAVPEVTPCREAEYLGDPTDDILCSSVEMKEIIGISNGGKVHEIDNLPEGGRIVVSPDRNWFVVYYPEGINLYSRKGELVKKWAHTIIKLDYDRVIFLWAPDGKGLYFAVEGRQLYYWSLSNPDPSLIFDGQSPEWYFFRFLIWVK